MQKRVRVSVIGAGNVSGTFLYTLTHNPMAEVVSVVDIDKSKAEKQAQEFGVKKTYTDYKDVLQDKLDAVAVITPHYEHPSQTMFFAQQGLDVLCEKPLGSNTYSCGGINFNLQVTPP